VNAEIMHLDLPLTEEVARGLKLGTLVTVSGTVFTGRSLFHIRAVEKGIIPALDYQMVNCFFHVGPVMRSTSRGWEIVSIEPTSSIRFERYSPQVIRKLQLRTVIGKTTMGIGTAKALEEIGGVHLTKVGLCGNELTRQVKKVCEVHFLEELGKTEATWVFQVENFGPFFVDIDSSGDNYFSALQVDVDKGMSDVYKALGIPEGFLYTDVSAHIPLSKAKKG